MASSSTSDTAHGAASTIGANERRFGLFDHAALWFSLGVGLLVMQVGASLMPGLSARDALIAIVAGSLLGAGLLAWVAAIGARHGLSSSALIGAALGRVFGALPVGLNVLQLFGWTAFELVVMRDGSTALLHRFGLQAAWAAPVVTLLWGALLIALAAGSMVGLVRRFVSRFGLPLVVLSLAWMSWQFTERLVAQGFAAWWSRPGSGGMTALQALDLVIAMPVSWLPLVADYARYGRSPRSTLSGTWLGYTVANLWCYALGVVVVATASADADLMATLLLAQGGLVALGIILIDEVDNAYGDVHSGAVSTHFLSRARWSIRRIGMVLALLATGAALVLPMNSLEPFLLLLSSVFVPLFGVVISQLAFTDLPAPRAVRLGPALLWIAGIVCFQLGSVYWPEWGSALPSLALTLVGGALLRLLPQRRHPGPVGAG
ncbi:MAG: putative hydroxymethylpyrimidine transporter CytX [Burkholderiaceae bacterium]|jgi:NCS1 family nucleobase:cation symporter-1|nr:MAG: putative hydroxymethylpyrimidine transporter CytX [Burkholderiaceae bacterium]